MKKIRTVFIILILLLGSFLMFTPLSNIQSRNAVNGIVDISNENFNKGELVDIGGQWELYYGKLLSSDEVKSAKPDLYYNVPGKLKNQIKGHNSGYMTLHFKIKTPYDGMYGIHIDNMFTSAEIYINGEKAGGYGQVGTSADNEKATYKPLDFCFNSKNREVDILIHTSVYKEVNPNITNLTFGTSDKMLERMYRRTFVDSFIIGVLTIAALINIGCYSSVHKKKGNIYFGAMCIIIILQQSICGNKMLCQILGYVPIEVINKINFISFYTLIVFYILFIDNNFKENMKIKKPVICYGIVFTLLCIFTNSSVYMNLRCISQMIVVIFMAYVIYFIVERIRANDKQVKEVIIPLSILIICTINGILVGNKILRSNYVSAFGVFIFVIAQSVYIVNDYARNCERLLKLNRDSLTSLYDNNYIKRLIGFQIDKYKEKNRIFSLIMIDVDDFKNINDNYGHMFGDKVIKDVAGTIKKSVEGMGYIGRFGGDEFVVILPSVSKNNAMEVADDILFNARKLNKSYDIDRQISLSIGVYENESESVEECMKCVDRAMYNSKKSGKGRVTSY